MTWQERLRQLDTRLAKGEIGAQEYRKARDEILAEASSGAPAPGRQQPGRDLWAAAEVKAARDEEAAAAAETTLVVKMDVPPEQQPHPEPGETTVRTTVNTGNEPRGEEDETTQVVSADRIHQAPVGQTGSHPQTQPPGVRPTPYRATPIQGQEVFAEAGSERGGMLVRILVPVLVLAIVGAGVWWFALRDSGDENPPAQPPPSSTGAQAPSTERIAALLPDLPGEANENNGTMPLERARDLKLFTPTYATMLADNGSSEIVYRGAVKPGAGYLLVASPIPPANGADGVAVLTSEHLQRAGFGPAAEVSPADPPVITRVDSAFRTFIAVYSSGDVWVQLNVSGPPDGDERALRTEFQKVLRSLTERLPAD